jgi:HEAT repeat protein
MLEHPTPHSTPHMPPTPMHEGRRPKPAREERAPVLELAKWPPDDADLPAGGAGGGLPAGGGGFGGGSFDPDEGNFKKGAIKPVFVLIGLLVVIGGVVLAIFAIKGESEKMTKEQIAQERNQIFVLPKAEQLPKWRAWAARDDVPALQQDAFSQLAFAKDPEGPKLIADHGLASNDHRVIGHAAMAIAWYGSPAGDSAKPQLLKVLEKADSTDKPQICWALAVLKEASAFDAVLSEYRQGHLASIQRLDGSPAFDPDVLAGMVSLDKLATYAGDESESVRQLTATILSRSADPKWFDVLSKLVADKSIDVAREAAVGLGKIANEASVKVLVDALGRADKDSRQRFLEALRDGVGTNGLVLALKTISKESYEREKFQTKQIMDMIRELEDPRGGDMLAEYADKPGIHPHWRTEAALRLAEIGDVRAVPHLAWRLTQDPLKLYKKDLDPEYVIDDNERVVSARMLADLAVLYPDKRDWIRQQAEDAAIGWATEHPQPHANALRFLAAVGSQKGIEKMRRWADPAVPLPKEGQQDFPQDWATAQSALRYIGWAKDEPSWPLLERQLNRRPPKVDATMESLMQGGLAVMGMTLRALGVGAAHGYAQWGDSRAYPILVKYIEDPMNNEQSRLEACFSLAWVATDDQMKEVAKKVHDFSKPDPKSMLIRTCYLETLIRRPVPEATKDVLDLLRPDMDLGVRHQAARALGFGGYSDAVKQKLFELLKDPAVKSDAMLAILIGADADAAARAIATYNEAPPEAMEELKDVYSKTFGYWSDKNWENGDVSRWVVNAEACRYVKVNDAYQDWPRVLLQRQIQGIEFDNGPHSITRVQFRMRLIAAAKGGDAKKRDEAIMILKFMKEKGVLMALRNEPAPLGEAARQAFFEVMNPKVVTEKLPEEPKAGSGGNIVKP